VNWEFGGGGHIVRVINRKTLSRGGKPQGKVIRMRGVCQSGRQPEKLEGATEVPAEAFGCGKGGERGAWCTEICDFNKRKKKRTAILGRCVRKGAKN